jgi:hypothetical protein
MAINLFASLRECKSLVRIWQNSSPFFAMGFPCLSWHDPTTHFFKLRFEVLAKFHVKFITLAVLINFSPKLLSLHKDERVRSLEAAEWRKHRAEMSRQEHQYRRDRAYDRKNAAFRVNDITAIRVRSDCAQESLEDRQLRLLRSTVDHNGDVVAGHRDRLIARYQPEDGIIVTGYKDWDTQWTA